MLPALNQFFLVSFDEAEKPGFTKYLVTARRNGKKPSFFGIYDLFRLI